MLTALILLAALTTFPRTDAQLPADRSPEKSHKKPVQTGGNHYCRIDRKVGPVSSPLMIAIWQGDLKTLAKMMTADINLNLNRTIPLDCNDGDNSLQTTPLFNANDAERPEMVDFLLTHGANPMFRANDKTSPLLEAASKGNLKIVRTLLKHGAVVDDPDDADETPLLKAAQVEGTSAVILELVSSGANIHFKNKFGDNAVMVGALQHNVEAVKLLVGLGVDACAKNDEGETAVDLAKANLSEDPRKQAVISFLQEKCVR